MDNVDSCLDYIAESITLIFNASISEVNHRCISHKYISEIQFPYVPETTLDFEFMSSLNRCCDDVHTMDLYTFNTRQ